MTASRTRTLCIALVVIGSSAYASERRTLRVPAPAPSQSSAPDGSPLEAAQGFLRAFDRLEWDQFRGYLADDMTMFFPFAQTPSRADGRDAVEKVFEGFFQGKRQQLVEAGAPITQGLVARDMKVQLAGPDAAVVTFHLGPETNPARRSIVLRRTAGQWKVIHWHASGIASR